jgi:hypothetical protein
LLGRGRGKLGGQDIELGEDLSVSSIQVFEERMDALFR